MFVFLALVFGVGFVAFGVGSDVQGGIADVLGVGSGGSDQPSISDARDKLAKNPNDAAALRELATALQTEGRPEEAIPPLESFTGLRPKNQEALRELAGLYLSKASRLRQEAQLAQYEAQVLDPGSEFLPPPTTPLGRALAKRPITEAATARANERLTSALSELQIAFDSAKTTYQKLAKLAPNDASVQIQLADAAQNANDPTTALAAYRKFLKLAPDDPSAPLVRQEIKRLQASPPSSIGG
jgi:cytochrome c-type biogenesis protein CcmH/NrfG